MADGRRHQNLPQGGSSMNIGASSSNSSNQMGSINQSENAVMIPLSAADLDILRASGIQFSTTTSSNISGRDLNLTFSGGSVMVSNSGDCGSSDGLRASGHPIILEAASLEHHHQQQQQQQQRHLQPQLQNFLGISQSGDRTALHSNEVSSNGIIDALNLGNSLVSGNIISHNSNDTSIGNSQQQQQQNFLGIAQSGDRAVLHSNEVSSNGIIDALNLGNSLVSGNIISLNSNDTSVVNSSSASGLIQALGAAVSRAVASGSFSNILQSSMNLPLSVSQGGILNGGEIVTFNAIPTSLISGANGQIMVNQHQQQHHHHRHPQQQQHHHHQQLVLNQGSSLVDGCGLMNATPTVNLHHGGMSGGAGMVVDLGNVVTSSPAQGNSSGVTVTLGSQQQQHMWVQPDQSGFLPAAVTLAAQEALNLQGSQGSISIQGSSNSQGRASLHDLQQAQIDDSHYQDVRAQFAGVFHMQAQNSRPMAYQVSAHSTFDQVSSGHTYQEMGGDSEATPSYSNIQQPSSDNRATVNATAQLIPAPTVDSSSIQQQQGFQFMYDAENRLLTVQRVMSPSDCTVSQSTLEGSEAQESSSMLPGSSQAGQSYTMVQVSSMPSEFASENSSAGEVSTSTMAAMLNVHNRPGNSRMGSLSRDCSSSTSHNLMVLPKLEKRDLDEVAECDTTQEDIEFRQHRSPNYLDTSNNIDDDQTMDSTSLHSTIQGSGVATSGDVIMDSTLDSSDLTTLRPVALETREMDNSQHAEVSDEQSISSVARSIADIHESLPGPSGVHSLRLTKPKEEVSALHSGQNVNKFVRKSRRLQLVQQEPKASQRKRNYTTQHYDADLLWCEDCMQAYDPCCPTHKLSSVTDKIVLSRAWASVPNQIQIFRIPEARVESGDSNVGVQAKRQIPKFTQFGPFVGDLVDSLDSVTRKFFPLMLECSDGNLKYFETADENKCNWMMFVRPAKTFAEQNLVAIQHKQEIYFNVTRLIECKQELKVWYAAHYAERLGVKPLKMTEEDFQALDEEDSKFGCFECSRKFRSSAALQQHLITHDSEDIKDFDDAGGDDEDFNANEGAIRKVDKLNCTSRKLTHGKQRNGNEDMSSYQWKKKSTSIYINKTLKKYKKRQLTDKMLNGMKSMYKRQGKVSGGNEWMCTHCELTFDNSSLLNLHTLTHAAEDLGMDEIKKLTEDQNDEMEQSGGKLSDGMGNHMNGVSLDAVMSLSAPMVACPKCNIVFNDQKNLMEHVSTHGLKPIKKIKPFDCNKCNKCFSTEEKLERHQMVHGDDANKPLECHICLKRVMNNSAMACHMKTHSDRKYYDCPVCGQDFDMIANLKEHSINHMDELGHFPCNSCPKTFEDFSFLKKHVKTFHSDRVFECPECSKPFPRVDKLRLHMLRHTSHREFMCETCGRQFKRKDKMKEHMKRMHSKERMDQQLAAKHQQNNFKHIGKFTPKVMPSEYHRFIYKCHTCLLGFKRRGMLVNHLAKRHPEVKPEHVPELNLPILKTQKDFYCQYCDKIYKSSSKRKAHITKNHPGCIIPPSSRKKTVAPDGSRGFPSNTFSHTVSSITTMPHGCKFCHKQYASKAKLLQHQRKCHSELVEPAHERRRLKRSHQQDYLITVTDGAHGMGERYEAVPIAVVTQTDSLSSADLLTQAMSELHSYPSEFTISPRLTHSGGQTMVLQPTTIDINQLNQALHSFTTQTGGVATVLTQPPQPTSPTQSVTVMAPNGAQTINLGNAQFITRSWTGGFTQNFR